MRVAAVEVVPVGKCPVVTRQLLHFSGDDCLERKQIRTVPGQKIPTAVLTLIAVGMVGQIRWNRGT
ncbi:hypothetical protein D3C85_1520690 [compost metagenome]